MLADVADAESAHSHRLTRRCWRRTRSKERAEALASIVFTSRSHLVHCSRTPSVRRHRHSGAKRPLRRVHYRVAASLDGFIAGPNGEIDWIVHDPSVDFAAVFSGFDTVLLGRRTYELTRQPGAPPWPTGWRIYVFSRSLNPADHPGVTVVSDDVGPLIARLRAEQGRDIWLFGGGNLFASLLNEGLVDAMEVAVMPVLLGQGIPLMASNAPPVRLKLIEAVSSNVGIVNLRYELQPLVG